MLAVWLVIVGGVAFAGSVATSSSVTTWYRGLNKPVYNPPRWLFMPVWTFLYILMAISVWLVSAVHGSGPAVAWFLFQLTLNMAWSLIFFAGHNPRAAMVTLFCLDAAIVATMVSFYQYSPLATWLMFPYLAWCCFASFLNMEIVRLNPTA